MNADELEKRIAELPETKVPAGWRQEILHATQRVRPEGIEQVAYKDSWWWKILWPSPWAWGGGTAAVWAVIVILNSYALDGSALIGPGPCSFAFGRTECDGPKRADLPDEIAFGCLEPRRAPTDDRKTARATE